MQESRRPRDQLCTVEVCRHLPHVLPVSILLTTPRERISPKQSSRASQLFLGPPRLATRVGRARKHERIGRGGRKRAKRRGGGGRRCPRCPALRALRHRSAPFWRKKAEAKKPLRTRLADPRRPRAARSNLFLSALLSKGPALEKVVRERHRETIGKLSPRSPGESEFTDRKLYPICGVAS